jgi:hypothetical protein
MQGAADDYSTQRVLIDQCFSVSSHAHWLLAYFLLFNKLIPQDVS